MRKLVGLFLLMQSLLVAQAQDWQWNGYVKQLQTYQGSLQGDIRQDNMLHHRFNLKYNKEDVRLGFGLRNRLFIGESVKLNPSFSKGFQQQEDKLLWLYADEPSYLGVANLDRAWINWSNEDWEVTLGRQRIHWGINTFWNVNDLFNAYNFLDFDYEERPGTDALHIQYYSDENTSLQLGASSWKQDSNRIVGFNYQFNRDAYDYQLIVAEWKQHYVIGGG
jgi:hypothetical protein